MLMNKKRSNNSEENESSILNRPGESNSQVFTHEEFAAIKKQSELNVTQKNIQNIDHKGILRISAEVAGNGVNFLIIRPL